MRQVISGFRFFLLLFLSANLASCGFHLRTIEGFSLDLDTVHVSGTDTYGEFLRELELMLVGQGVEIAPESSAEYTINIRSEQRSRRPVATSADISVSEYELRLGTVFSVTARDGKVLIKPTTIIAEKIYSFDRSSFIGSSEEEERLIEEMRREVAGQLLRRFNASLKNFQSTEPEISTAESQDTS